MPSKRKGNTPKKQAAPARAPAAAAAAAPAPAAGSTGITLPPATSSNGRPLAAAQAPIAEQYRAYADAKRARQIDPENYTRTPKSGLLVLILLGLFSFFGSVSLYLHYKLPTPRGPTTIIASGVTPADAAPYHPPVPGVVPANKVSESNNFHELFSEGNAVGVMQYLSVDIGYRIVGTKEHVEAEDWLEDILRRYEGYHNTGTPELPGRTQVEVFKQIGDGAHRFDFMSNVVWKRYYSMSNLVVRISDGTDESKANSLLLNAHLDSTLPSPGGADDGVGVAILLEALRTLTLPNTGRKLYNSVVLLFNDGEESLQDASHLYITQHNQTNAGVKAVVNLEACGTSGPELLFQATSKEMIEAYSHVPHPFGTVLANDVFSTGLILSDTDFRQFVEYGNDLSGLDMALVGNSYYYHTRRDTPTYLEPGATQHFGENTLAIIEHLCLKNASSNSLRSIEPHQSRHTLPVYFSIAGRYFVLLQNKAFKSIVMGLSAFINFQLSSVVRSESAIGALNLTILSAVSAILSMIGAALSANIVAVIMTKVLGKGMSWYSHEFFPIVLYGPPALAGILTVQLITSKLVKPHKRPYLERSSLSGLGIFFNLGLLGMNAFGIGSAYLMALASFTFTIVTTLNDFVIIGIGAIEEKLVAPDNRVSAWVYPVMTIIPGTIGVEGMVSFLDLFVPLTGRMGEISPADHIIASIVAVLAFLCLPIVIPLSHRYTSENLQRTIVGLLGLTAAIMAVFASPGWKPFDEAHPKRLFVHQVENITSNEWFMNVGAADPAPGFRALANELQSDLGIPSQSHAALMEMNDYNSDFDILYPVSAFLTPYKFQLPTPASYRTRYAAPAPESNHFTVKAVNEVLDVEAGTRSLTLEMTHPGVIWSVVAFDAEILSWNLPSAPPAGYQRHHLKSVARHGIYTWSVDLTLRLTPEALTAAKARSGGITSLFAKSSSGKLIKSSGQVERDPSRLWIDASGLVADEMYPQHKQNRGAERPAMETFIKMDELMQKTHPEIDVMMLTVVAGVFEA
ncbi:Peptidase M28 [Kalmanozyma brasiliensis GHG001]|uniref:Peptide hydrolase n=1 Tax=Kalmanozyma brasiliensis (strain GHG001) TaxID=1365824 RepID=V5GTU8_KALBG|nr:Peptidase M28 [Kalmanozyma brasiliensis GHG001]EST09337.1 Peptidase M28 [Kalmanozyma brasiliensis GHG001]